LGIWYILAGVALLVPRSIAEGLRVAGLIFNYTGAAASHVVVRDGPGAR
jgi:hypothetical protein